MGFYKEQKLNKKKVNKRPDFPEGDRKSFVNIRVDRDHKSDALDYMKSAMFGAHLDRRLQGQYRVTVKGDGDHECFVALMFCYDEEDPNFPYILSARASTVEGALSLLAWADERLMQGVWQAWAQEQFELFA